jgi:phosphatidylserine/phosphatidylglycerophosphate/cardiolipin synthase-like enzyme
MQTTKIGVRFLVRIDGDELIDAKTLSALNLARENLKNFQARTLPYLHSKVILLDQSLFYLGSANWYWYSLHKSLETTVTGKTDILPGLITEIDRYWEKATPLTREDLKGYHDLEPLQREPY